MSDAPWWKRAVVYEIYPLSFQDTNGDGKGDLEGVRLRLDHVQWLGVDTLWLGPVYPSPMRDFGYDVSDFCGIDPVFGSLEAFDRLLGEAHARGLRVVLDFVPNHTSDEHPWFRESRRSRDTPKSDWYVWVDPGPDGGPPNNWLCRFGGSPWQWVEERGQFYYHAFLKEQPDLNWRNPKVRAAMKEVLRFWMRRGVDGFRVDAAAVLAEDALLRDDPPNPDANAKTPPPEVLRRVYTNYRPEVREWLAELREVVDDFPGRVLLGEVDTAGDNISDFYGTPDRPLLHLPLNYRLLDTPWKAKHVACAIEEYLGRLPEGAWPDWVIGSHDKKRVASLCGQAQARVAALAAFTLPGTPMLYAGDEIGMEDVPVPGERALDPFERLVPGYGLNRDPHRAPMQWSAAAHAGFTTGTPWLPVANDHRLRNVEAQKAVERSMLSFHRRLIALRRGDEALNIGAYRSVPPQENAIAFTRMLEERRLLVLLNVSHEPQPFVLPGRASGRTMFSTHLDREGEAASTQVALRGDEGLVLELG